MREGEDSQSFSFSLIMTKINERDDLTEAEKKLVIKKTIERLVISNSMTAHPTNPFSTEFTREAMSFERSLVKGEDIGESLQRLIKIPAVKAVSATDAGKKSQDDEALEALSYFRNIYESVSVVIGRLKEDFKGTIYEDLELDFSNFYDPCSWLAGDGDGNPNATAESLQSSINIFREKILSLYESELDKLGIMIPAEFKNLDYTEESFLTYLEGHSVIEGVASIIDKVKIFGFRCTKFDIRHEAGDITDTVIDILRALDKMPEEYREKKRDELEGFKKLFASGDAVINDLLTDLLKNITEEQIEDLILRGDALPVSKRIFARLKVVAKNPGCSDKMIIAECKSGVNALASLFLLKVTGSTIQEKGAVNVVTLSESADDLLKLADNIAKLLENPIYRDHVAKTGRLFYMIAKSDTQRRGGVAAQYTQEKCVEDVTKKVQELVHKYPELHGIELIPFNGGGHALQRGGGKLEELANPYARGAMRGLEMDLAEREGYFLAEDSFFIQAPTLTTQGHQNGILFSSLGAEHFLYMDYIQALYSSLKMQGILQDSEYDVNMEEHLKARKDREVLYKAGRRVYERDIFASGTRVNSLFANGIWVSANLGNSSSRPSKRKGGYRDGDALTAANFKSAAPQLTDQRAIGSEKMCAHTMTQLITWYSMKDGLDAVLSQEGVGIKGLNEMYKNDKSTRDSFRSIAVALYMTNFNMAWQMLIGEARPKDPNILLSEEYNPLQKAETIEQHKQTLSFIEGQANETAKIIYQAITGKEVIREDFNAHDLLQEIWPNLAKQIDLREDTLALSHAAEILTTQKVNSYDLATELSGEELTALKTFYAACDQTNAPVGQVISVTRCRDGRQDDIELSDEQVERVSLFSARRLASPAEERQGHSCEEVRAEAAVQRESQARGA